MRIKGQNDFPEHWGKPPTNVFEKRMKNVKLVDLPGGYGKGTVSVAKWISVKMEEDLNDFENQEESS